jgi:hypothetical protein
MWGKQPGCLFPCLFILLLLLSNIDSDQTEIPKYPEVANVSANYQVLHPGNIRTFESLESCLLFTDASEYFTYAANNHEDESFFFFMEVFNHQ